MKPVRKATLIKRLWQLQDDLEDIQNQYPGWRLKLIANGSVNSMKGRIEAMKKEIEILNNK